MPRIRLLTAVAGEGPVTGKRGDVLDVDAATARVWADGERAERVPDNKPERPEKGRGRKATAATVTRPDGEAETR